ncbi:MAG: electron transfer flavoprotein subunit beta/FixA family protein [Bacteroidia bacterium]|nr:electron transfer flavoprotein subunit beta/FixA family protein [Bacteroidia bacterium]
MKILVCISHVPDTTTKIQFEGDGSKLNKTGVTFIINPYCEYGLSRAIGFQEEGKKVAITALCVGGPEVEPTLRRALAIGADDAVRINADATDAGFVAKQIANYCNGKEFDVIFTGKESIDFNGSLVPGMLAEYLESSFVSYATHMDIADPESMTAQVKREVDGGEEVMEVPLPAVISCQKGIAEWRIPNMRGIMGARKKPLSVVSPNESLELVATVQFSYPPAKGNCQYFQPEDVSKLVDSLTNKGLV